MDENKIIIRAPFYRGFLQLLFSATFYVTLGCAILVIAIIISKKFEMIGIIVAAYGLLAISLVSIKFYQKLSKSKIVINEQEIAKYSSSKKIMSINFEQIENITFTEYSFATTVLDEYNIYFKEKSRIRFYAPKTIVEEIEKLTNKIIKKD